MTAAVFVDFENLFASLKSRSELTGQRTRDLALTILENLKNRLHPDAPMVLGRSYAAFDAYPGMEVAHDLALMGFDPQYVIAAPTGRNSADVQIAVDVCRVLFRRPDIETVVIVSGDGHVIPIARQVLEENRGLRLVALPDTSSADLRMRVGGDRFISALDLLPEPAPSGPTPRVGADGEVSVFPDPAGEDGDGGSAVGAGAAGRSAEGPGTGGGGQRPGAAIVGRIPVTWGGQAQDPGGAASPPAESRQSPETLQQFALCLDLIVKAQLRHGSRDIWLSPFLKGPMSQHFSSLVHPQRRALINELRNRGAIRVEERENQFADHPYSVIVLDENHPWVAAALERAGKA